MNKTQLIILAALLLTSCGRNVRDECFVDGQTISCPKSGTSVTIPTAINGAQGEQGIQGEAGADAEPCTVTDTEKGAIIECPDGSSVEVFDGDDGKIIICHRRRHGARTCRG